MTGGGRRDRGAWRLEMTAEEGPPNADDAVEAIVAGTNASVPGACFTQAATATATAAVPESVRPICGKQTLGASAAAVLGVMCQTKSGALDGCPAVEYSGFFRAEYAHTLQPISGLPVTPRQIAVDELSCVHALLLSPPSLGPLA
ncbi:unnamed protein product [Ectocarpus fasciculatus]